jgi:branched-chain amino acid transport system substrate-binding protein
MFAKINKLANIVILLGLLLFSVGPNNTVSAADATATAAKIIAPISIVTTKGSVSGSVTRMKVKDQTGIADNPLKYVLFKTPSTVYDGYRNYTLPAAISVGNVTNIKVAVNYKGLAKSSQTWSWYLFNWVKNTWVKVGDNTGAVANVWKSLQFNVTVNPTSYVNNMTRQIRLRLVSNNASGDARLDYEAITLTYNTCADALGCVTVRPGDPIHIAYLLNAPFLESKNGALVAIDDSAGKILGHTIKFDGVGRANCDPTVATADSVKMRKDASIIAVIGTACSSEAMAVMPGFSASGFSMVSPSNTNPSLTEPGNPNNHPGYFRTSWSDKEQSKAAAQYAYNSLGATKAATINDQSGYSAGLEQAFVDEFTALGGAISTRQSINPGDTDMSIVLGNIAADPPGIIYMPVFLPAGGYLIVQARATTGITTVPLMGSDVLYTPDVVTAAGAAVEGFLVTGVDPQQYSAAYTSHFVPAYTAKFGVAPNDSMFSAHGYDAFRIIRAAIIKVAVLQANGSLLIGRQALRNALYATTNFVGLTGTLTCSATGDCADPAIAVYRFHIDQYPPEKIWPAFSCADPIGCITLNPTDPIHIAYLLVTSGTDASLGIDSRNGAEVAIDDSGGKILGHNIQFDGQNGGCNPTDGLAAGTLLAADTSIVAIVGSSCSSEAIAAMPLISQAGMAMVSPSNTNSTLTEAGNPNNHPGYLRVSWSDKTQGSAAAQFAWSYLGLTKAATISDGSWYSNYLQQAFVSKFVALGGTVTSQESITPGQTDMSTVLTSIAAGSSDMIYMPVWLPEAGYLIVQARDTTGLETTHLMGSDTLYTPNIVTAAGSDVEGFKVTGLDTTQYNANYASQFLPAYFAKFGTNPISVYHAHAYDAFMLIKAAIEKVAVVEPDGTIHIGRQALRSALYSTADYIGLTGTLTCSATGDCSGENLGVFEYHAGVSEPTLIWP